MLEEVGHWGVSLKDTPCLHPLLSSAFWQPQGKMLSPQYKVIQGSGEDGSRGGRFGCRGVWLLSEAVFLIGLEKLGWDGMAVPLAAALGQKGDQEMVGEMFFTRVGF